MIPKSFESKYLNSKNAQQGMVVTFTNEGEEKESDYENEAGEVQMQFLIGVRLTNGEEKVLRLNRTSYRNMAGEYGSDTKEWIGKSAMIHIKNERVGEKFRDVIYLSAPHKDLAGNILNPS